MEAIDEMLLHDKIPSPKLLNFLCALADGQFITNEKLQEIENHADKTFELQKRIEILEKENQSIKMINDELKVKLIDVNIQKEKIERQNRETNKKFDERLKKLDSSPIEGIVKFE